MAIEILMPALSPTMTEGNLVKWLKKEGDKVKPGDVIAEIETDKATMEVESVDFGTIGKIIVPAKTNAVKVNQLIAILLEANDDASAISSILEKTVTVNMPLNEIINIQASTIACPNKIENLAARIFATPLAKKIANTSNIDLSLINGSGPRGRILKDDVLLNKSHAKIESFDALHGRISTETQLIPHSQMRKVIAKRLSESKQSVPHFYLTTECNVDLLLSERKKINTCFLKDLTNKDYKISINDFIIKACAHALEAIPQANCSWSNDGIIIYNNIDISVAVAIDDGLITPIVKNANMLALNKISGKVKELIKKAKNNSLRPDEFQGGSFTISNLGMFGIEEFTAIINPPQACILAVGAVIKKPVVIDDELEIASMLKVTLSCDHRAIDGAVGAKFLQAFKAYIENPIKMLA